MHHVYDIHCLHHAGGRGRHAVDDELNDEQSHDGINDEQPRGTEEHAAKQPYRETGQSPVDSYGAQGMHAQYDICFIPHRTASPLRALQCV